MLRPAPELTPEIAALLGRAMFPDPARIERTLKAYCTQPDRTLFVWKVGGEPVSAAGLRVAGREAEVLHIGTRLEQAERGYGRQLLHALAVHLNLWHLTAETDDSSVEFYRRSGFEVVEAAERGGQRRYLCTLNRQGR